MMALSTMFNIIRVVPARDSSQNSGVSLKVIVLGIGIATFAVVFTMITYFIMYCRSHRKNKRINMTRKQIINVEDVQNGSTIEHNFNKIMAMRQNASRKNTAGTYAVNNSRRPTKRTQKEIKIGKPEIDCLDDESDEDDVEIYRMDDSVYRKGGKRNGIQDVHMSGSLKKKHNLAIAQVYREENSSIRSDSIENSNFSRGDV